MPLDKEKLIRAWAQFRDRYPSFDVNPECRCYPNAVRAAI